jgi:hypothetical protein
MSVTTRKLVLTGAATLFAVPTVALTAVPAHADVERHGACGGGRYELSVDRERGGYEVSFDLDRVKPGSRWKVVLRHDGDRFVSKTFRADREGDIDVDRVRPNTRGADTFKVRATRVHGKASCTRTITVR